MKLRMEQRQPARCSEQEWLRTCPIRNVALGNDRQRRIQTHASSSSGLLTVCKVRRVLYPVRNTQRHCRRKQNMVTAMPHSSCAHEHDLPVRSPALIANTQLPWPSAANPWCTQYIAVSNAFDGGSASGSRRFVIPRSLSGSCSINCTTSSVRCQLLPWPTRNCGQTYQGPRHHPGRTQATCLLQGAQTTRRPRGSESTALPSSVHSRGL